MVLSQAQLAGIGEKSLCLTDLKSKDQTQAKDSPENRGAEES